MKRFAALLMIMALLLGLAACGSTSQTAEETTAETEESAAVEETADTEESEDTEDAGESETTEQFRVGMECAYAPNNWQEDEPSDTNYPIENVEGAYAEGYDVQIAKIIAEKLGRELVIVKLAWSGLIEALNQGQIDAIIAGMADTAERRESINFTEPYHETEYGIMVNSDSVYANATSLSDFAGASILGQKDTMLDTVIDQIEGVNHLPAVSAVPDMLSRLEQGTCDGIVVNMENTPAYLESNPNFVVISFEEGEGFDLGFVGACVGLRKSDDQLLSDINDILATIDDDTRTQLWDAAVEGQPS